MLLSGWALGALVLGCDRQPPSSQPEARSVATAVTAPSTAARAQARPAAAGTTSAPGRLDALELLEAPLHAPDGAVHGKLPLVLVLHGLGASAEAIEQHTDWPAFAKTHGIAWLAPNGAVDRQGRRFWDAGPSCCNFDGARLNHVAALSQLLERTLANPQLDRSRVYVVGYSNGGFMAHRLACERPELLRGIVSMAGAGPLHTSSCQKPTALRVLEVHGDADLVVTYEGGHLFKDAKLPVHASAEKTAADWAASLGCDRKAGSAASLDLDPRLPGAETRVSRYGACPRGSIELWTVGGGSHYIGFRSSVLEDMWNFLQR